MEYPREGSFALGFRTMTVEEGDRRLAVVYVPTNNLYLGEVLFFPEEEVVRMEITVEQAVKVLVSGGTAAPRVLRRYRPGEGRTDPGTGGDPVMLAGRKTPPG